MLRRESERRLIRERGDCGNDAGALTVIVYDGVAGAVVDLDLSHALDLTQICFQNIRLLEAHPPLLGVDTHPACGFMQDLAFHGLLFGFL